MFFSNMITKLCCLIYIQPILGFSGPLSTRIIGGSPTTIKTVPFMASIELANGHHICGGSIVSQSQILTAAHCTLGQRPDCLRVRVGSSLRESGGEIIQIAKIHVNNNFSFDSGNFDVSILELKTKLNLGSVKTVSLASKIFPSGTEATIFGWGSTKNDTLELTKRLKRVTVKIIDKETCQQKISDHEITEEMLCAGILDGGKDACQGDSGGPLIAEGVLAGVVSWGTGCGAADTPGIFANVAVLRSYIDRYVKTEI